MFSATAFATALLLAPLSAQEKTAPRVSLGFAAAPPGRTATIPLSLERAAGMKVVRVASVLRFPAPQLSFVRLEKAALLNDTAFEAVAEVRESGLLDVRISSRDEARPLRDGVLAYLVFRILPETDAGKTPDIAIAHTAKMFAAGSTETTPPLATVSEESKLVVENPDLPVFACFFYMH